MNGFSPVCEWLWIRSELGREKALLHVGQMYRSWLWVKDVVDDGAM